MIFLQFAFPNNVLVSQFHGWSLQSAPHPTEESFSYTYSAMFSLNSPITPFHLCWSVLSMAVLSAALRRTQGERDLSAHSDTDSSCGVKYESTSDKPHVFPVADRSTLPFLLSRFLHLRPERLPQSEMLSWIFFCYWEKVPTVEVYPIYDNRQKCEEGPLGVFRIGSDLKIHQQSSTVCFKIFGLRTGI